MSTEKCPECGNTIPDYGIESYGVGNKKTCHPCFVDAFYKVVLEEKMKIEKEVGK